MHVALLLLLVVLAVPLTAASAQESVELDEEPRVERITFQGTDNMAAGDLRSAIVTQETRCRALLLKPFCWLGDWSLVVEHHYLNYEELERDVVRLRVYYFRRGFREAQVSAQVLPEGEGVEVLFTVEEGEPTIIEEMAVHQTEDILSSRQIRRARLPGEGERLNLVNLELGMAHLQERLGGGGYLDAVIDDTVRVERASRRATVEVVIDPGPRSTLKELDIDGNSDVEDDVIAQGLRLKRNRVLRSRDIVAARRSLYESNLFHEVDVTVSEQEDSAKVVEVTVREAPPRSARLGGGFNTIEFFQTEARFTHYNWLGGGRRLDLRATVGNLLAGQLSGQFLFHDVVPEEELLDDDPFLRPTWQASIGFLQPAFQSAENVFAIELFANRRTIPGVAIDRGHGFDISLTRRLDYDAPLSLSYSYELTSIEAGDLYFCVTNGVCDAPTIDALQGTNTISPAGVSFRGDYSDDPLSPSSGHRVRGDVEYASNFTLSDYRYVRVIGDGRYYLPGDVHRRRVLAGRIRLGWVRPLSGTAEAVGIEVEEGDDERLLHPRKRFYAGGARSVRGFGENQLGPQILTIDPVELLENGCSEAEIADATCDPGVASMQEFLPRPIGGTAVVEASVEYRFPLFNMTGALFLDGAMIGEGVGGLISGGNWAITPGTGVRIATPVGPVRIDLGVRPGFTQRYPVVTEFIDEAGDRQLVELERRRRYNPVEAAGGGFLREIFSRLALHLSVGEAY